MPVTNKTTDASHPQRKRELGLIHMGKDFLARQAGMTAADYDADYRKMLLNIGGKTSAAELDAVGRDAVLRHMKSKGFRVVARPGAVRTTRRPLDSAMHTKLRALWYALAEVDAVDRPASPVACDAAVEAWAKRQLPALDALRFASAAQLGKLIEEMKQWGTRVKACID